MSFMPIAVFHAELVCLGPLRCALALANAPSSAIPQIEGARRTAHTVHRTTRHVSCAASCIFSGILGCGLLFSKRGGVEALVVIVHHRDSHHNLVWHPILQPQQGGSPGGYRAGEMLSAPP